MKIDFGKLFDAEMVHPLEYESAKACQSVAVYDWLAKQAAQIKKNLTDLPEAAARWFPVNQFTSPRLHGLYMLALKRLNCAEEYPLFLKNGYDLTAKALGSRSEGHMIVMNDACAEELNDGELLALLGQQIGHIRGDHIQQLELLDLLESSAQSIPMMGTIIGKKLWSYFADWLVASQYTADRAAVFAAQSVYAVESLLLRQIGLDPASPEAKALEQQPVKQAKGKSGVFFIKSWHEMPAFGNVERIQEVRAWVRSGEMKKDHPQVYYQCRVEENDPAFSPEDESVLRLHASAMEGDAKAAVKLAELYIQGKEALPVCTAAAACLFQYAACQGDPLAMRYLIGFMQHGIENMENDERRIEQLFRAAYSRKLATSRPNPYGPLPVNESLRALVGNLEQKYGVSSPGGEELQRAKDAFWIPQDDDVYSCSVCTNSDGWLFGLAAASTGLYGRTDEKSLPFMIKWEEFEARDLYSRETDDGWWIFSGPARLIQKPKNMHGTMAELLILLKKACPSS